jgi:PAS domain S-box-containing protein
METRKLLLPYIPAVLATAAVTVGFLPFRFLIQGKPGTVAFVQIVVVVLAATRWGSGPALAASLLGVLAWDYFFLHPSFAFGFGSWTFEDAALILTFLAASVIVAQLSARAKLRAEQADASRKQVERLYADLQRENVERKDAERKFRMLLEATPDALTVVDSAGKIYLVNAQTERLLGYARDELHGRPVEMLMPEQFRHNHSEHRADYAQHPQLRPLGSGLKLYALHKDGRKIAVDISLSPLTTEDGDFVVAAIRERKQDEILRRNDILEQRVHEQTAELTASNRVLENFSYLIAHDLRAPLRAIHGHASIIADDYMDGVGESGLAHVSRIRECSELMGLLIDNLLELSRIMRTRLHRQEVRLCAMARGIAAELTKASERSVQFSIDERIVARADAALIELALRHLLHNAWKFTRSAVVASIEFGVTRTGGEQVFFVRDNGVGFDPAYADKLFDAFQQLHEPEEFEGAGIGLTIAQRIIHRHGGRIWAEGAVGKGATFYFTLPSDADAESHRTASDASKSENL